MHLVNLFLNDPVVLFSFGGLAILLGICGFYVYYFLKNVSENN